VDEIYHNLFVSPIRDMSEKFLWKIFDVKIIDGFINNSAKATGQSGEYIRKIQSGVAQNYAVYMLVGIILIVGYLVFG
jgi:NADH-quinone oxidoreductase subunit L